MEDLVHSLLDPAVKQESYEEFLSKFEHGVVPTVAVPNQDEEAEKVKKALKELQEASRAVTAQRIVLPDVDDEKKTTDDDNISELSRKTDSTISAGPGSTASILDNPELQKNVKFDNFVDGFSDSLHPSDISDAESFEWVHVAGKDGGNDDKQTTTTTPPNTPALTDAALAKLRDQEDTNNRLSPKRVIPTKVAGPELPPAMKQQLKEAEQESGNRAKLSRFSKMGPALPPGWCVDVQTLKSRPPGGESERVEDQFTQQDAQLLHHKLLTDDSNQITTDADTIVSEAELLRGSPNPVAANAGKRIPTSTPPAITSELFGLLNTPQKESANEPSFDKPNGSGGRPYQYPPQTASSPHTDKPDVWTEDIESFNLDPDFNYDNITSLKVKPRTPYEVGETGH